MATHVDICRNVTSDPGSTPGASTRVVAKRVAVVVRLGSGTPDRAYGQRKNPIRHSKDVWAGMHYGASDKLVPHEALQPEQVPGVVS